MVAITDLGFRYGYGVFETLTVRAGVARWRDWHEESLRAAAAALGLAAPDWSPLTVSPPGDGLWRWYLTPSGLRTWFQPGLPPLPAGYRVEWSPLRVSASAWDARYKTLSYLTHYQAKLQGRGDEALLLNERGEVATAAMANVFWSKDGVLFTPLTVCGCRAGVVRRWVLEQSGADVRETVARPATLAAADEIFLTNSRIGIMPVAEFDGRSLAAGPLTVSLRERFLVTESHREGTENSI
ncbi:MAG: aminotransferase class IV [Verrucomicrobiales bacterium]|nr:aminotransferase class IV [Verrucomicrobiales bacterium]